MTLQVLKNKVETNRAVAHRLRVTEGTIRYHLRRQANGAADGRKKKCLIEKLGLEQVVHHWWQLQSDMLPKDRSPNLQQLWCLLAEDHQYSGSYKSVRKYVRSKFPLAKLRPFRRVETPPGAQTQSDWLEAKVEIGRGERTIVYGFLMTLSHSRMTALVWSLSMNQLAWHRVHNEAFKRLGGVAAVNRIDNLKTGVAHGAGPWGQINESYQAYARTMGFHVDPHEVRQPQQKGKAERRVGAVKRLDLQRSFPSLDALQQYTDEQLRRDAQHRQCPVTGNSVFETWQTEQQLLRPLPTTLPEPFDLIRTCPVHKDSTIRFEGRTYCVPFPYAFQSVEVRGCSGFLQIVDRKDGRIIKQYPRHTVQRLFVDPACYEGMTSERVSTPRPLGRMARKLDEIAAAPVQLRSIEIYAQLAEVAR